MKLIRNLLLTLMMAIRTIEIVMVGFVFALVLAPQPNQDPSKIISILNSASWDRRAAIIRDLLKDDSALNQPAIREALKELLSRESHRSTRVSDSESESYQAYYEYLIKAVTKIAERQNETEGAIWYTLALSNYNDDSAFALYLAKQPKAWPVLIQIAKDKSVADVSRARVLFVLAESCEVAHNDCDNVRNLLITQADTGADWVKLAVVRGLAICGKTEDIQLLKRLGASSTDKYFLKYVADAEDRIARRDR